MRNNTSMKRDWSGRLSICISFIFFLNFHAYTQNIPQNCNINLSSSIKDCIAAGEQANLAIGLFTDEFTAQSKFGKTIIIRDKEGNQVEEILVELQSNHTFIKILPITLFDSDVYSILYTDEINGCEEIISVPIHVTPDYEILKNDISCQNENDGSIQINALHGQILDIEWENGETDNILEDLSPGVYNFKIKSQGTCFKHESIIITEPEELSITINEESISCSGENENILFAVVEGGNGSFEYDWDMDGTGDFDDKNFVDFMNPGTYSLTVRDQNQCEASVSYTAMFAISHSIVASDGKLESDDLVDDLWARFDLMESSNPENGDIDKNGMEGSFMDLTFYESLDNADTKSNAIPNIYIAKDSTIVFARIESNQGCYDIGELTLRVALRAASLELDIDETCSHQDPILLSGGIPEGGTYERTDGGPGVYLDPVDGKYYFDPPLDQSKVYNITYTAPDGTTATDNIAVQAVIFVAMVENSNICEDGPSVRITKTPNSGGVVSGLGEAVDNVIVNPVNGNHEFDPTGLDPGTYEILVTYIGTFDSGHSCNRDTLIEVHILPLPEVQIDLSNDIVCSGDDITLSPNVNIAAPDITFSYEWRGPNNFMSTDPMLILQNTLLDGERNYSVTVTASNGCSASDQAFVDVAPLPDISCDVDSEVACFGDLNGIATVTVNSGEPDDFTFEWSNGELTRTATLLNGGNHDVTVTDMNGCKTTCLVFVDEPELTMVDITITADVRCHGEATASAVAEASGGTNGFTYLWSSGETTALATELVFGINSVTATDLNGCEATESIFINEPDKMECEAVQEQMVYCHGDNTGQASVTVTGGNGTNTYLWDNGETTANATMLTAGMHSVTATDARGCTTICTVEIEQPEPIFADANPPDLICFDTQSGVIDLTISGGSEPYKIDWDNDETGDFDDPEDLLNAGVGNYGVTVMDNLGCMYSTSFQIDDFNEIIINPNTFETCDDITVNLDGNPTRGSNAFVTHEWSIMMDNGTGITENHLISSDKQVMTVNTIGLDPGEVIFTYKVIDSEDCESEGKITLNILPNPTANPDATDACTGTMIFIDGNASNGDALITDHFWEIDSQDPGSATNVELDFTDQSTVKVNAMNASSGTLNLLYTAIDEHGCEVTENLQINIVQAPNPGMDKQLEICNGLYPALLNLEDALGPHDDGGNWMQTGGGLSVDISDPTKLDFECIPSDTYIFSYTVDGNGPCVNDGATIEVEVVNCFDLAIRKRVVDEEAEYGPGSDVLFSIEVFNQGLADAYEVWITDYIQEGMIFDPNKNTAAITGNDHDWQWDNDDATLEIGHIPPHSFKMVFITLTIEPDFDGTSVTNLSEITYYTNGNKPFPPDEDNLDIPGIDEMENDDDIEDDSTGGEDNPADNDQLDGAIVPLCYRGALACNDLVQISLDPSCQSIITPDMILEGADAVLGNISVYLLDDEGNEYPPILTADHIGDTIAVNVLNNCTEGSCWGYVTVEDKTPPTLECEPDITLNCFDKNQIIEIQASYQDCSDAEIVIDSDDIFEIGCFDLEHPGIKAYRVIVYRAVDIYGNSSEPCVKKVYYKKTTLSEVLIPTDQELSCSSHETDDYSPLWDLNNNGYPEPNETGFPTIDGVPIIYYDTETGLILSPDDYCTINGSYTDQVIDICSASFKVLREWLLLDWCSGEIQSRYQIIKVLDTEGPYVDCSSDPLDVVSTSLSECAHIDYLVPDVENIVLFDCASYTYEVEYAYLGEEECHTNLLPSSEYQKAIGSGNNSIIPRLELGCTQIKYTITDDCGNVTVCIKIVEVEDNTRPYAICDQHTTLSIDSEGSGKVMASTFDDGSFDNCSDVRFGVRRMDGKNCDLNNPARNIVFSVGSIDYYEYEYFCCSDLGSNPILVELIVIDENDNYNFCMIELELQDKFPPVITCPEPRSVTLDCEDDYSVAALGGAMASYTAACDMYLIDHVDDITDLTCGEKNISRIWRVINNNTGAVVTSCTQSILIRNLTPVNLDLVGFPDDIDNFDGCQDNIDISPNNPATGGYPLLPQASCSAVASTHSDQIFRNVEDACLKIVRTWTVIDWCAYDPDVSTTDGIKDWVQIIKVKDNYPPVITGDQYNTFYAFENCSADVDLSVNASDICTPISELEYKYEFDANGDGIYDETVYDERRFERQLAVGHYYLRWMITDNCGNVATFIQDIWVKDEKPPTPYCYSDIVSVIIQNEGNVTIWANDFNLGSEDNCSGEDLYFTFGANSPLYYNSPHYYKPDASGTASLLASETDFLAGNAEYWQPETKSSGKAFTCADLGSNILQIYVEDQDGNKNFCAVEFDVQDNNNYCGDASGQAIVSGIVSSMNNNRIEAVEMTLDNLELEYSRSQVTDLEGEYAFNLPAIYGDYILSTNYDGYYLDGVSTLDIILIQKHILGVTQLESKDKLLAADINHNGDISATDLVALRKIILGVVDDFPLGKAWMVVPKIDLENENIEPHQLSDTLKIENLIPETNHYDFIGIKIGDVNQSSETLYGHDVEIRSMDQVQIEIIEREITAGSELVVPFTLADKAELTGIQFTLGFNPEWLEFKEIRSASADVSLDNIGLRYESKGLISFSWNDISAMKFDTGDILFELVFDGLNNSTLSETIEVNSNITLAEAYDAELEVLPISINIVNPAESVSEFELFQNSPNPFSETTNISFNIPTKQRVMLTITDLSGKAIYMYSNIYGKGFNEITITNEELRNTSGILIYSLETEQGKISKRMLYIK